MINNHTQLFIDPKIQYPINDLDLSFSEYISECRRIITSTRVDLTTDTKEQIINANTPFQFKIDSGYGNKDKNTNKKGVLLIHGLLDSPFYLRDVGEALYHEGFLVKSIVLPGHGTVPGALLNVTYQEWIQAMHYGIHSLSKEVDQIFLVGESTGASLALYWAMRGSIPINGLILISPALKIKSPLAPFTAWHKPFDKIYPRAAWFYLDEKNETKNIAKYKSITYNAINQVYQLSEDIKNSHLKAQPSCPIFIALSQDDRIICPQAILRFFQQHDHSKSRMLIYGNQAVNFNDKRITLRPSAYPSLRIINFSHISIHIAPNNPYYGKNGTYYEASHIDEKNDYTYGEFLRNDIRLNELLLKLKLTKNHYQRLTLNPDFNYFKTSVCEFIKNIT